ncbi:uncharacterized protein LOC131363254 [Hemibagrus wyckioides]|nr:uncharacterized protein LOC131363254 [Hemibagrus wyckioides]
MLEEGWGTSEHEQTITSVISEGEKERKKSQEDLDTETSLSMPLVLCPSPQELGVKIMTDQHSMNTSPCPPEASRSALRDTPSPDQKSNICNKDKYMFMILNINVLECTSQHTLYIYENIKEVTLKYIQHILETSSNEQEIYKYKQYIEDIKMCYGTLKKIRIDPNEKRRQYAVAYLCKKDGSVLMIGPFSPRDRHSEDFIIEEISELLKKNEIIHYSKILIYTVNSPCIGRKGEIPCMCKLIDLSVKLSKNYGIKMYIAFSTFYVFIKNIADIIGNSKELEDDWMKIIEYYNLQQVKFSVTFPKFEKMNISKKKIPRKKRQFFCETLNDVLSVWSKSSEKTCKEWIEIEATTEEILESTLRNEIKENTVPDDFFDTVINICKKVWTKELGKQITEIINEQVVRFYLNKIQAIEHYPVFIPLA